MKILNFFSGWGCLKNDFLGRKFAKGDFTWLLLGCKITVLTIRRNKSIRILESGDTPSKRTTILGWIGFKFFRMKSLLMEIKMS